MTEKKCITVFNSFEETEEYGRREMANHTPHQRLLFLEQLRKRVYNNQLNDEKKWKPLKKIITVEYAVYL